MRQTNSGRPTHVQLQSFVQDFKKICPISDRQALELLETHRWNLQGAINYYQDVQQKNGKIIDQTFEKYADLNKQDCMLDEGITKFCTHIGIDIMDPITLYISWKFCAENMCVYTRSEFLLGMASLKCLTIDDVKSKLKFFRDDFQKPEVMKQVYKYCFDFGKGKNKDLPFDFAKGMWEAILVGQFPLMPKLIEYLNQLPEEKRKPITKDTWNMVWEFNVTIGSDLGKYDYKNGTTKY